jgi:hypothetical protein
LRRLKDDELIEVFMSKSVWHEKYKKAFVDVEANHRKLFKWLERKKGAPTGQELFGVEQNTYTYHDLERYFMF